MLCWFEMQSITPIAKRPTWAAMTAGRIFGSEYMANEGFVMSGNRIAGQITEAMTGKREAF